MPIRTVACPQGICYYTDDNKTWRRTRDAAKKNSPYYKKKKYAMELTTIKMVDMDAIREMQQSGTVDPDAYQAATYQPTAEEKAAKYEDAYAQKYHVPAAVPDTAAETGGAATNNTVSADEKPMKGYFDGVVKMRLNGRLPTSDRRWIIDPVLDDVEIQTVSTVRGLGGKATGAVVLGTDDPKMPAINVVAFGTFGVEDQEIKTRSKIKISDFIGTDHELPIKFQLIEGVPNRQQAFSLYDPSKAKHYATIVQAMEADEKLSPNGGEEKGKSEEEEDNGEEVSWADRIRELLSKAKAYAEDEIPSFEENKLVYGAVLVLGLAGGYYKLQAILNRR
jgi:hypothetical protein